MPAAVLLVLAQQHLSLQKAVICMTLALGGTSLGKPRVLIIIQHDGPFTVAAAHACHAAMLTLTSSWQHAALI